jgi:hypothetical protein
VNEPELDDAAIVAARDLICAPAGEPARPVALRVRAPVRQGAHWLCEARLDNLYQDSVVARGVDSLQALQLALEATRGALATLLEEGGQLQWADGSGALTVDDLMR